MADGLRRVCDEVPVAQLGASEPTLRRACAPVSMDDELRLKGAPDPIVIIAAGSPEGYPNPPIATPS